MTLSDVISSLFLSITIKDLEWCGTVSAMSGSLLLSQKTARYCNYGWVLYFIANVFLLTFVLIKGNMPGLVTLYCWFVFTSVLGTWNFILVEKFPRLPLLELKLLRKGRNATS